MKQPHDIAVSLQTDTTPRSRRGLFRSWLKIQVENERYQPPHNGLILLQVFIGILFFVLVTRLWYLQIQRGEEFARLSLENRLRQE
ncbi:MAG: hypothetical protein LBR94_10320, partial [Desulfovibrio sp.]|nr:hypothetical protein [Desulfovibrio sp.]